jgi:hypothetical protein
VSSEIATRVQGPSPCTVYVLRPTIRGVHALHSDPDSAGWDGDPSAPGGENSGPLSAHPDFPHARAIALVSPVNFDEGRPMARFQVGFASAEPEGLFAADPDAYPRALESSWRPGATANRYGRTWFLSRPRNIVDSIWTGRIGFVQEDELMTVFWDPNEADFTRQAAPSGVVVPYRTRVRVGDAQAEVLGVADGLIQQHGAGRRPRHGRPARRSPTQDGAAAAAGGTRPIAAYRPRWPAPDRARTLAEQPKMRSRLEVANACKVAATVARRPGRSGRVA